MMAGFGFAPRLSFGGPSDQDMARAVAQALGGAPIGFGGPPGVGLPQGAAPGTIRPAFGFGGLPMPQMPPGAPESQGIPVEGHPAQQARQGVARERAARGLPQNSYTAGAAPPMPLPPARPAEFGGGDPRADLPAEGAMPVMGQAPPMAGSQGEGSALDGLLSGLGQPAASDAFLAFGQGLLSSPTFAGGLAAGAGNFSALRRQRAATDLAGAEYGLRLRKLAQEQGALGGNAALLKRAYPSLTDAEASAQASNGTAVTEALKIIRDPNHGRDNDPTVIAMRAEAQARGSAAGKPDEVYTPLSEQDRIARGYPAGSYQMDSRGKVSSVNATGTTINMGAEKAQDATVGKAFGEQQVDLAVKGRNAASTLNTLAIMEQQMSLPGFYSGLGADRIKQLNATLGALGVKDPRAASGAEVFDALSNKVVLDGLGGSLGPGISNTDRDYIGRTAPTLQRSVEGNRALIGIARSLAQRQQVIARMAREYAAAHNGRLDGGFDQQVEDFAGQNPLFPTAQGGATASAPQEPPQGAPAGTRRAPDGKFYAPDPNRPGRYMLVQ